MGDPVVAAIASSLVSGLAAGGVTVIALRVHVQYLRETVDHLRKRIDAIDERLQNTREAVIHRIEQT